MNDLSIRDSRSHESIFLWARNENHFIKKVKNNAKLNDFVPSFKGLWNCFFSKKGNMGTVFYTFFMETTPKKTKANTKKINKNQENSQETPLVKPLSKKHLNAVETYQALEDDLTFEEKNSKIPLVIAFLSALALIVGLSIFLSQVSDYSDVSPGKSGENKTGDEMICSDSDGLVCGVNGLTYKNACVAESAKVLIEHDGECLTPTNSINLTTSTGSEWQSWSLLTITASGETLSWSAISGYLSDDHEISSRTTLSTGSVAWVDPISNSESIDSNSPSTMNTTNNSSPSGIVFNLNSYTLDPKIKIATYNKKEYNYSYSFPVATFFQWFIAPKGVTHEMVLKSLTPPTSRLDGDVVVDFYRWKLLNELQWEAAVIIGSRYYVAKWDSTFIIEDLTKTAQSKKIIDTILATLNY